MKNFLNFCIVIVALLTISSVSKAENVTKQLHIVQLVNLNTYVNNLVYKQDPFPEGTITGTTSIDSSTSGPVTFNWSGDLIPPGSFWDLDDSYTSYEAVTSHISGTGSAGSITIDPTELPESESGMHTLSIKYYDEDNIMEFYALNFSFFVY
jgi:hypothetical protein